MQTVTTIGFDIAKSVFQVHGVDGAGQVVIRRQLKRRYVLAFFQKLPPCLVGIEACASSHHWSRATLKKGAFWNFQTGVSRSKIRGAGPLALLRPGDDPEAATRKSGEARQARRFPRSAPVSSLGGLTEKNRDVSWPARQILRQNNPGAP